MSDFLNQIEWKMKMCLESGMRVYTAVLQYVGIIQELRDTLAYYWPLPGRNVPQLPRAHVLGPGRADAGDLAKPTPDLAQPIMVTLIESEECNKFPYRKRRCKS